MSNFKRKKLHREKVKARLLLKQQRRKPKQIPVNESINNVIENKELLNV